MKIFKKKEKPTPVYFDVNGQWFNTPEERDKSNRLISLNERKKDIYNDLERWLSIFSKELKSKDRVITEASFVTASDFVRFLDEWEDFRKLRILGLIAEYYLIEQELGFNKCPDIFLKYLNTNETI